MQNVTISFDIADRMMKLNQTVYNAVVSIIIPNYQIVEFQVYRYNKISYKGILFQGCLPLPTHYLIIHLQTRTTAKQYFVKHYWLVDLILHQAFAYAVLYIV